MVADRIVRRIRRSGPNPVTKREGSWWTGGTWRRSSDPVTKPVDDEAALGLTAFYRGVTLIASTLASLPMHVFEENADGTRVPVDDRAVYYLTGRPNVEMRRRSFWERVIADEVRGNAFIFVDKDGDDQPIGLWYLDRNRVRVGRTTDGTKVYEVDRERPMIDYRQGGEIVHIPNWGNGLVGYDPVRLASQAISLGLSAQEYASRTFSDGQIPPGLLITDAVLTEPQADAIKKRWRESHGGPNNQEDIGVLGSGAKFQQLSRDLDKMQMETLRRFQVQEIARLLGIPPHLLADVAGSTSWGTGIEEQNRGLWSYTLLPHVGRIEEAIDDDLLVRELTRRYCKFEPAGLLRGSTLQRYQAYRAADFMTPNEKRKLEDLPAVEGGDVILQQINQAPLDKFDDMDLSKEGQGSQ